MRLLYIVPMGKASDQAVLDELTLRMVAALRQGTMPSDRMWCGVHTCVCGARSANRDVTLPNGWVTNTLCVHYLAYHRSEVPPRHLRDVRELPLGHDWPTDRELVVPELRSRAGLRPSGASVSFDYMEADVVRWTYRIAIENCGHRAARLTHADVMMSVDAVCDESQRVELAETIPVTAECVLERTAVFRLAEFRRGRSAAIAASLSLASEMAVKWTFHGEWADGEALSFSFSARASVSPAGHSWWES